MPDFLICPCDEQRGHCQCMVEQYNLHHRRVTCRETTHATRFGLYDDPQPSLLPAYILHFDDESWIAKINNPDQYEVDFKAIDHCVPLEGVRCDGMLIYDRNIVFLELKDDTMPGWLAHGREQLTNSIRRFAQNHNAADHHIEDGYVCNAARPKLTINQAVQNQIFKDDTAEILNNNGIQLNVRQDIDLQ